MLPRGKWKPVAEQKDAGVWEAPASDWSVRGTLVSANAIAVAVAPAPAAISGTGRVVVVVIATVSVVRPRCQRAADEGRRGKAADGRAPPPAATCFGRGRSGN